MNYIILQSTLKVADFKFTERPLLVRVHFKRIKKDLGASLSSCVFEARISLISSWSHG